MAEVAALTGFTIDIERDIRIQQFTYNRLGVQQTDRCAEVKRLADFPRSALLAHLDLQIAPGHVQANRIPVNM